MLKWKNKQDGVDDVLAEDINNIANELIASQISIDQLKFSKQEKLTAGRGINIEGNIISATGGGGMGGGTTDYEELDNLPKINGVELVGNKTASDLLLVNKETFDNTIGNIGTALDELHNYAQAIIGGAE